MDNEALTIFELKYKYSRAFWLGITGFHAAVIALIWMVKPMAFDFRFSKPVLDENSVYVIIIGLISVWALWDLRKKEKFASYVLNVRETENLAIGYLYSPMTALSITCFGLLLAFHLEYAYSFVWCAVGLLGSLFVFPSRSTYEKIFQRVNADYFIA